MEFFTISRFIIDIFYLIVNRKLLSIVYYIMVMKMKLSFGEKVKCLREQAELNQTQLGEATHMTQRKISYIERDKFEPSLEDLVALCRFFDVSADYLLGLNDK